MTSDHHQLLPSDRQPSNRATGTTPWRVPGYLVALADEARNVQGGGEDLDADSEDELIRVADLAAHSFSSGSRAKTNATLRIVIGRRFVEARKLCRLEQTTAAALLGYVNSTQLSLVEAGKRLPPLDMLMRAADVFGVSLDWIMGRTNDFEPDSRTAIRMGTVRRMERLLRFNAEAVAEALLNACAPPSADELRISGFSTRARALIAAVDKFRNLNGDLFDDRRGGATLQRAAEEMRDATDRVDQFLHRSVYARESALSRARERTLARTSSIAPQLT